jgi:hypothetical protein
MAIDPELRARIENALRAACTDDPSPDISIEDVPPNRIAGHVLSKCFGPMSPSERQDAIWRELDAALSKYERTLISFIVTDTPDEYRILTGSD